MEGDDSCLDAMRGGAGHGDRLLVLLHGMGAYNAAWLPMVPFLEASWPGPWIAPSLRGHGASFAREPYGFGTHAADVATLIAGEMRATKATSVSVVGHSFGGIIGAMLATGWFGIEIDRFFCFSVKFTWAAGEIERFHAIAKKPPRISTRAEALERSLKYSGLAGLVAEHSAEATAGIVEVTGGYRVRMDPRALAAMGPDIDAVFANLKIRYALAAGKTDPLATLPDMLRVNPAAFVFETGDHNAHVEHPAMVWRAIAAELLR